MAKAAIAAVGVHGLAHRNRAMLKVLALSPLVLAPGFTIVLMLDAVYRIAGRTMSCGAGAHRASGASYRGRR